MLSVAESRIVDFAREGRIKEAIALAEESVELLEDEGLEMLLADEYAMLAMLWIEMGDTGEADIWGRRAWSLLRELKYVSGEYRLGKVMAGIGELGGRRDVT
jgi:tetratricopeptide (TPR) repeat protein